MLDSTTMHNGYFYEAQYAKVNVDDLLLGVVVGGDCTITIMTQILVHILSFDKNVAAWENVSGKVSNAFLPTQLARDRILIECY